jgi:hypothetical protein
MMRDAPTFNYTIRYACVETTAQLTSSLQPYQLINSIFMAPDVLASKTLMSIVDAIKIVKIEAWCPPGIASGASSYAAAYNGNTLRLGWVNSATGNPNFGRDRAVTDTTMGVENAHVVLKPVKGTTSAMWQVAGSNQPWELFYSLPPASVIDFHLKVVLNCQESATSDNGVITVVATPAAGVLYFVTLGNSSGFLVPQCGNYIA